MLHTGGIKHGTAIDRISQDNTTNIEANARNMFRNTFYIWLCHGMTNRSAWPAPCGGNSSLTGAHKRTVILILSLLCWPKQAVQREGELPMIWDAMTFMWRHCIVNSTAKGGGFWHWPISRSMGIKDISWYRLPCMSGKNDSTMHLALVASSHDG